MGKCSSIFIDPKDLLKGSIGVKSHSSQPLICGRTQDVQEREMQESSLEGAAQELKQEE